MKRIVLLVLLFCVCGLCFAQQSYYVSANGNNNNDGLSEAKPLKSLETAFEKAREGTIKRITVIGTLNDQSEGGENDDCVFYLDGYNNDSEIVITGKKDASSAEKAVLSGKGSNKIVVQVWRGKVRFEHIEISSGELDTEGDGGFGLDLYYGETIIGTGAVIRANKGTGVIVIASNCTLAGGEIRDNEDNGVYIFESGTFTMNNGTISNNRSSNYGGGIIIVGTFTMNNGTISYNRTADNGGGVYIGLDGSLTLNGGTISGNTAAKNGGGVFISVSESTPPGFTMTGGTISGNTAENFGGGVYIRGVSEESKETYKAGIFKQSGGSITNNSAGLAVGGVYVGQYSRYDKTGGTVSGNTALKYFTTALAGSDDNITRMPGSLGSTSSGSVSSSGGSSSSSGSSSGSSGSSTISSGSSSGGSSSKNVSFFDWHIPLFFGLYLQGWHQNLGTFGLPFQLGVELDFDDVFSLALLGEAGGGLGYPYLFEYNLGGMAELYFLDKTLGVGFGGGTSTVVLPYDSLFTSYEPGQERAPTAESGYLRFSFILRRDGNKTSFFAHLFNNGDWGFGIQFAWDCFHNW